MPDRGGGRGFVALADIAPGELVLMECPSVEIPSEPRGRDPSVRCVLHLVSGKVPVEEVRTVLRDLRALHPRQLGEVDAEHLARLRKMYQGLYREVSAQAVARATGLEDPDEFLRLVCAFHFNGFATGIYVHLAMINHSCAPNCVKWGARDGIAHSEVRATRRIRKGEEITISYLVPAMRSREARHRALRGQFQFDCTCVLCAHCPDALEQGPAEQAALLESALEHLEEHELLRRPHLALTRALAARDEAERNGLCVWRPASLRAAQQAHRRGAPLTRVCRGKRHLSLARADMIITDSCLALLDEDKPGKSAPNPAGLVFTLLKSSLSIRQTQCLLFSVGMEGPPEAEAWVDTRSEAEPTLQHIASGIGYFVSMGKKGADKLMGLTADNGESLFTMAALAVECHLQCDRAASRIADLYV
jgi:hypothetical protein